VFDNCILCSDGNVQCANGQTTVSLIFVLKSRV